VFYDPGSNVVTQRLRDAQQIGFGYDNVSRLTLKDLPESNHLTSLKMMMIGSANAPRNWQKMKLNVQVHGFAMVSHHETLTAKSERCAIIALLKRTLVVLGGKIFHSIRTDGTMVTDIDKCLVRRTYALSSGECVEIVIAFPENGPDDWYCFHSIKWEDGPVSVTRSPGIDALDAILRATKMIRFQLSIKAERSGKEITWDGNPDIGLSL
jgi:hypothetical protein